jgi:hypothetical protein
MIYQGQAFYGSETTLGNEMVVNGTFTGNATGWTLGAGWAYGTNNVAKTGVGVGTLTQTAALTIVAGQWYKVTLTISGFTSGSLAVALGGTTSPNTFAENGVFVLWIKSTDTTSLIVTPAATTTLNVDDVSVKPLISGNPSSYSSIAIKTTLAAFANVKERNLVVDGTLVTLLSKN